MSLPTDPTQNPYAPPSDPSTDEPIDESVFNSEFRTRQGCIASVTILAAAWLLPIATIITGGLIGWGHGAAAWAVAILAIVISITSIRLLVSNTSVMGYQGLCEKLAVKLQRQGAKVNASRDLFVQFSPANRPQSYENFTNWDVGFLWLLRDEMVYLGDRTSFRLSRDNIEAVKRSPCAGNPSHPQGVYVLWHDDEKQRHVFNVSAGGPGTLRELRRQDQPFAEKISRWFNNPNAQPDRGFTVPLWLTTTQPINETEEGMTFWQQNRPITYALALAFVGVFPAVAIWLAIENGIAFELVPALVGSCLPSFGLFVAEAIFGTIADKDVYDLTTGQETTAS